ncbi:VWA domain-containing protein [Candidatus Saccharibacteria bacterium]|nr:VWA domain-containing protein [Candidatus Saccharibacteria bacterium]
MNFKKKLFNFLAALTVIFGSVPFNFANNAYADDASLSAPTANKRLIDNGDGTYTIALSVTGETASSSTTSVTKANVVLVVDTSSSMVDNRPGGPGTPTRLALEQDALTKNDGIIDNLLRQNVPGDPIKNDIIEVSVVQFGNKGRVAQSWTTNSTTLKSTINGLSTSSGTNWEEGLRYAKSQADEIKARQADEDVYIIFMTDGEPTTHYNSYTVNWQNIDTEWTAARDDARDIVTAGYKFYALFTWGASNRAHYLSSLVQYAYTTGNSNSNATLSPEYAQYYTNADSTDALVAALNQIVNDITTGVGYTNVELTDGVTEMTSSSVKASTTGEVRGLKYYRSGGAYSTTTNDGLGDEWTEAPHATINANGEVDWDLGDLVLEDGVTYTVAFAVWPKQSSLDLVSDLNNGIRSYSSLTEDEKKQVAGSDGNYTLKTNTDYPMVTYSTVTTTNINGQTTTVVSDPMTARIENPDPVDLYSSKLSVKKEWEDGLDPDQQDDYNGKVTLDLYKDNKVVKTYELSRSDGWESEKDYSIAPGVMVYSSSKALQDEDYTTLSYDGHDYVILEQGHKYHLDEQGITSHYYLTKYEYHPMVVNGEIKNVLFEYTNGEITGIEKIESLNTLSATNTLKGGISIFKEVLDKNNNAINELDETFKVKLSFENSNYPYTYRVYYGNNNPCSKDGADTTTCNFDPKNHGRTNKMTGTGVLERDIYVGDEIMIVDVDTGTKFKVEEVTDGMKSWYELKEVKHDITRGEQDNYGAYKESEIDGDYRAVQANSSSRATVVNNYITGDLKISKTVEVESGNEAQAKAKEFEFTINVYTDENKTEKLDNYSKTVKLKTGQSETISDIPAGAYYEVAETGMNGFVTASTGENGSIVKNNTSKADFTNTYKVEPNNTQAKVAKMFGNYWDLTRINGFDFELTPKSSSTGTYPEITSSNTTATQVLPASWTFKVLDEGTWTYEITEKEYNHPGVSPLTENEKITLTVKATDNGDGTLKIEKTYTKNSSNVDEDSVTIDNTYKTQNTVSETIGVTKTVIDEVTGNHNDRFTFELKDASGNVIDTVSFTTNNLSGEGSFKALTFDEAGTYRYTVSEKISEKGGWDYDDTIHNVVIEVTEDYTTALLSSKMTIDNKEIDTADFTNEYSVGSTSATVEVTKDFKDYWYEGDSFTFTLESEDGKTKIIKSVNQLSPTATFTLEYDAPGEYEYTITEDIQFTRPGISQVTTEPITVKISVIDNNDGTLTATVTQGATGTIENKYDTKPVDATIKVKKAINDLSNSKKDGRFTFDLKKADGSIEDTVTISTRNLTGEDSFGAIEFTKEGTYKYTVSEREGNEAGFGYDTTPREVEIVVEDNKKEAQLFIKSVKIDGVEVNTSEIEIEIENTYEAKKASVELSATKDIDGRSWLDTDEFEFTLSGDGIETQAKNATKNAKKVTFDAIEYTKVGTYQYTISETGTMPAGMRNLTGEINVTVMVEDKDGKLVATAEYSVDDQTIVNEYNTSSTSAILNVEKAINDLSNSNKDGSFTFDLKDSRGKVVDTITINTQSLSGAGSFKAIEFDEAGTYAFTVTEQDSKVAGFSYDTTPKEVEIVVKDDTDKAKLYIDSIKIDGEEVEDINEATVEITNDYKAKETSLKLSATKAIEGREWLDNDKFDFTLSGDEIEAQTATATKNAKTVTFKEIKYTKVGAYYYTISETGSMPSGMMNITGEIEVTVNVEDKDGELVATAEYSVEDQTIVNEYTTAPTNVRFNIKKIIKDLSNSKKDATFRFAFNDAEYAIETNNLEGELDEYIELSFSEEQTLEFEVYEINDKQAGFKYDDTVYEVSIKVRDDYAAAELRATITVDGEKVDGDEYTFEFENKYQAAETEAQFGVEKVIDIIDQKNTTDEDFEFELADRSGKILETIVITGEGEGEFTPITFKKVGTYKYTVSEVIGSAEYYEYDPAIYDITVKVIDRNGQLEVESTVTKILGGDEEVEVIVFTNVYNEPHKEPKTPDTGRFTIESDDGASEVTYGTTVSLMLLFGILLGLISNKNLRGLIRAKRHDIIARNE